jgi:hypothetical protein
MRDMLKNLNYTTKKFSHGYELFSDGVTVAGLGTLEKHINSGGQAFALVDQGQFNHGDTKIGGFFGNHWIVLNSSFKFDKKKNTVIFTVYDNHFNNQSKEMKANVFMDMIFDVIMTE